MILGSSTRGLGDLQDDRQSFLPQLEQLDLSGKKMAIYGTGDQEGYPDSFVDAIGILAAGLREKGAQIIGQTGIDGYGFNQS